MVELAAVAERMRMVHEAQRRFLGLWALECLMERRGPGLLEALEAESTERFAEDASLAGWQSADE